MDHRDANRGRGGNQNGDGGGDRGRNRNREGDGYRDGRHDERGNDRNAGDGAPRYEREHSIHRQSKRFSNPYPGAHLPAYLRGEHGHTTGTVERNGRLPTPGAPPAPRRHPNRPPGRGRSLSPPRGPDDPSQPNESRRQRSPRRPTSQGRTRKFGDPMLKADKNRGRIPVGSGIYKDIEDVWAEDGDEPTKAARVIQYFVENLEALFLLPKDIDAKMFRNLSDEAAKNLARTIKVIEAQICARVYDKKYAAERWNGTLAQIQERAKPGKILIGQVFEKLYDDAVGIDDLNRTNGIHGSGIDKDRLILILKRLGTEALLLPCYGFGDNGKPPSSIAAEYGMLKARNDISESDDQQRFPIIRCWGVDRLTKTTYFRYTRPIWISLKRTPFANFGEIIIEDYPLLADLVDLDDTHPLRLEGQRLKQAANELVAGVGRSTDRPQMATRAQQEVSALSEEGEVL